MLFSLLKNLLPQKNRGDVAQVIYALTKKLQVKLTHKSLLAKLELHPNYPSLLSVSESLEDFGIDNMAVGLDESDLEEVDFPVLGYFHDEHAKEMEDRKYYVVMNGIENGQLEYYASDLGWTKQPWDQIKTQWTGTTLLVAPTKIAGEENYTRSRYLEIVNNLRKPLLYTVLGILAVFISLFAFSTGLTWASWLPLATLKIGGAIISVLLLMQVIDKENPLNAKVCQTQENMSCEDVLSSPAAKLFGWLSMSELGSLYFLGTFLALIGGLISGNLSGMLGFIGILNVLALPYTVFSVFYQWKVVEKWCKLCLYVQAILGVEFVVLLLSGFNLFEPPVFSVENVSLLGMSLLSPLAFWLALKGNIGIKDQLKRFEDELTKFKRMPELFEKRIEMGREVEIGELPGDLVLGNSEAPNQITVYTNPFCSPCKDVHKEIDELLNQAGKYVKVLMRFSSSYMWDSFDRDKVLPKIRKQFEGASTEDLASFKEHFGLKGDNIEQFTETQYEGLLGQAKIAIALVQMVELGMSELAHEALKDWYSSTNNDEKEIDKWVAKLPIQLEMTDDNLAKLSKHNRWAAQQAINGTPSLFVNGKEFRRGIFKISDLSYYVRHLAEKKQEEAEKEEQQMEALPQ